MIPLWTELAAAASVSLSDSQVAQLDRYIDLLLEANQRMNLTRIESREAAEVGHVADALTLLRFLPSGPHRLVDVGSGGGVPGIPLAIARPNAAVTLVESTQKKANFLREAAAALALANVSVVAQRAEDVGRGKMRETFDVATARAVGALSFLVEWCLPLLVKGGKLLAQKGPKLAEELPAAARAIRLVGGGTPVVHPIALPGTTGHVVLELPKIARGDGGYPRPATQAKGRSL